MTGKTKNNETFYPKSRAQWRQWLEKHHVKKEFIWLIQYKKNSGKSSISWVHAVEEALCFGWVDSKRVGIDNEKFMQFFCKRKPKSTWSKINKEKVELLIKNGQMTRAGFESVEIAKNNGSWNILDTVEGLEIPDDLNQVFKNKKGAKAAFLALSKSVQKAFLHRLHFAKRPETRLVRIEQILSHLSQKEVQGKKGPVSKK